MAPGMCNKCRITRHGGCVLTVVVMLCVTVTIPPCCDPAFVTRVARLRFAESRTAAEPEAELEPEPQHAVVALPVPSGESASHKLQNAV